MERVTSDDQYQVCWQCLVLYSDKLYRGNFRSFWYSHYLFESYFNNETLVNNTVFSQAVNISAADYNTIYTDRKFGMNNVKSLAIWVRAYLIGDPDSWAVKVLNRWFTNSARGVQGMDAWAILNGTGNGTESPFTYWIDKLENALVTAKQYNNTSQISN